MATGKKPAPKRRKKAGAKAAAPKRRKKAAGKKPKGGTMPPTRS